MSVIAKRLLALISFVAVFAFAFAGASLAAGCSGQNSDENNPMVVTETVNGTVKVTTTGP